MNNVQINWRADAIAALEKMRAEDAAHVESRKVANAKWFVEQLATMTGAPITMEHFDDEANEVVFDGIRFARRRYYPYAGSDGYEETFILKAFDDGDEGETYDVVYGPIRSLADIGKFLTGQLLQATGSLTPIPKPPDSNFFAQQALASVNGDDREIQQGIIFGLVAVAEVIRERS